MSTLDTPTRIGRDTLRNVPRPPQAKPILRRLQSFAGQVGVPLSAVLGPRCRGSFGILMYHRVCPDYNLVPTYNVTPERFRRQLTGLLRRGFRPWSLPRLIAACRQGEAIPSRAFAVTFDDGYANNLEFACPILTELGVPATVFLATAYVGTTVPFPFDRWATECVAPEDLWIPLSWDECRSLQSQDGITLGSHTHSHTDFRGAPGRLADDLGSSLETLTAELGQRERPFAFPYGTRRAGFSGPELANAARMTGVTCALSTESQVAKPGQSAFDWGRFTASQSDSAATLAAKLDGWFTVFRDVWRAINGRSS